LAAVEAPTQSSGLQHFRICSISATIASSNSKLNTQHSKLNLPPPREPPKTTFFPQKKAGFVGIFESGFGGG